MRTILLSAAVWLAILAGGFAQQFNTRLSLVNDLGYQYGKNAAQTVNIEQAITRDWNQTGYSKQTDFSPDELRQDQQAFRNGWLEGYAETHKK